jgi:hypothetical protein
MVTPVELPISKASGSCQRELPSYACVAHTGVVAEAVSSGAVNGDRVHGQGLGSVDREGLDRRVLDGKSIAML